MLKLDVSNISPRSNREATAGTLFQVIVPVGGINLAHT